MKTHLQKQHVLTESPGGAGKATRKMVRERAVELASIKGRMAQDVSKSDWEQAKRELADNSEPKEAYHESAAESEQWDPIAGSTGYKVHVPSGDDEDDEGRSDTERLVERGVKDAGRDRVLEAARDIEENE
jgi:hypothetical protein